VSVERFNPSPVSLSLEDSRIVPHSVAAAYERQVARFEEAYEAHIEEMLCPF
jgi:hypothetical protein